MTRPLIRIRGLCKAFDDRIVLKDLDLDIMPEESMVVIGQSGIGKSVLIKCILGLLIPDKGEVVVDGENWCRLSSDDRLKHMRRVGMLFQGSALFDSLPVWKNVAFALLQQAMNDAEARNRASEILEWVGLPGIEDKMPVELSGGMMKRVGLARAICHRPDIVFFDEPTTGLDPIMADTINHLIQRLHREFKTTQLSITHDLVSARKIGDSIAMLYQGGIHRQIRPERLDSDRDPVLRQFVEGRAEGPIRLEGNKDMIQEQKV
ncbi:MAG: ABC transporter ATP-binding protein [Mariprofundaceae bacterium]